MKKNKSSKLNKFLLSSVGALFAITMFAAPMSPVTSFADANPSFIGSDSGINIVVHYTDGSAKIVSELESKKTVVTTGSNQIDSYCINWCDIEYFEINFTDNLMNLEKYNYQYNLKWAPAEIVENTIDFKNDRVEYVDILNQTVTNKEDITRSIKYFIENDAVINNENTFKASGSLKEKQEETGAWGVYQFSFTCEGTTWSSDLFEVKATKVSNLSEHPFIKTTTVKSNYSVDNAYNCVITDEEYKYVDPKNITWYVNGKGADGSVYVLMPEDKTEDNKAIKTILPDNSYNRNGLSFVFDFPISGDWEITCSAYDPLTGDKLTSNVIEFSTVKVVPSYIYIIIVGSVVVAASIVLAIIIKISKKREKVW